VVLPLIFLVALNAINFGYYFVVLLHLASAPRESVEYSIQGSLGPASLPMPKAGPAATNTTVSYLAYKDMANLKGTANAVIQVCSTVNGFNNPGLVTQNAKCTAYPAPPTPAFPAAASDPESPTFVLHRVDVQYTIKPLISAMSLTIGGQTYGLFTPSSFTFHRQVSMRAIGN
jgi:hypothetical protein